METKTAPQMTTADRGKEADNRLVFSYLTLRNLIGFGGISLPVLLAIFPRRQSEYLWNLEPSISDYFYTDRGDILVVTLSVLGVFLITYKGYTWKEQLLTITAAIGGLGVAFVPTKADCNECIHSTHTETGGVFTQLTGNGPHFAFAAAFLLCLAIMSLVYFPQTDANTMRTMNGKLSQKAKRNRVFRICGWVMIASVGILGGYFILKPDMGNFPIIFVFETLAVWAFGLSWITKGETLWPDKEHYIVTAYKEVMRKPAV